MKRTLLQTLVLGLTVAGLSAGDLPADIQAKFIKILATNAGSAGKVACKDPGVAAALGGAGMTADPAAKVAWAGTEAEVKAYKAAGKMVICGRLEWLPAGGSIAVVEEGGKPQIYLHMGNLAASGVTLSDAVLKIGKRL
ncbi:MAG: hypothetical protein BWY56_00893 [Acidobacteria bacterium ADurb.Bin340]|jgi:hypothetical protein|nr:MAG: hypothetical protein BWY56_00893 [Acidobacteria bacterium ADurb.Bin340]